MQTIEENILHALSSQKFARWYGIHPSSEAAGRFEAWITGDDNAPTREEILQDIRHMFNL